MRRRFAAAVLLVALLVPVVSPLATTPAEDHASEHGHPGCPWKDKGPCPHGHDMDVAGAVVTPCPADEAETPGLSGSFTLFPPVRLPGVELVPRIEIPTLRPPLSVPVRAGDVPEPPPPRATSPV